MKSAPLPKGESQLIVKATLRHRGQVNDSCSATFQPEPTEKALDRYALWSGMILGKLSKDDLALKISTDSVWKLRFKKAERALRLCACPQPCSTAGTSNRLCDRCAALVEGNENDQAEPRGSAERKYGGN